MNDTCKFCGTVESVNAPNCSSYEQATERTDSHPYGCPWFNKDSRERFAAPGCGGWRPIETAPKDKTQIIVCGTYSDDVAIVRWDERKKDWLCLADGVAVIESQGDTWTDYSYFSVPSHWQPCPVARRAVVGSPRGQT